LTNSFCASPFEISHDRTERKGLSGFLAKGACWQRYDRMEMVRHDNKLIEDNPLSNLRACYPFGMSNSTRITQRNYALGNLAKQIPSLRGNNRDIV
jgi:hypothetical protein